MAPELLFPTKFGLEKGVPSKEADIYALGMTVYQVLTGKWPFFSRKEAEVTLVVLSGERPPKPEDAEEIGMTETLWDLLSECWKEDRTKRPSISEILGRFCDITGDRKTTDSTIEVAEPRLGAITDCPISSGSSLALDEQDNSWFSGRPIWNRVKRIVHSENR
jgi:serine/threonine protein kinase